MVIITKRTTRRALIVLGSLVILLLITVWAVGAILLPSGPPEVEQAQLEAMAEAFGGEPRVSPQRYDDWERTSFYLPMRDGVQIAVDLWLPKPLEHGATTPAVIFPTRYWRRWETRIASWGDRPWAMDRLLLSRGYAVVKVDARGSGASFGSRPYPWSPDEVADYEEVVDWIAARHWSNGRIGVQGTSYGGTAAEFVAALDHPDVRAAAVEFSLYDVYRDIAFPGGVFNEWFVSRWGMFNAALDAGTVPEVIGLLGTALVGGPAPVEYRWTRDGFDPLPGGGRPALKQALQQHAANVDIEDAARRVAYRDQIAGPAGASTDDFSPSTFHASTEPSDTAILSVAGWYDGAYARSALERFQQVRNADTCIIGAWNHGGGEDVDPFAERDAPATPSRAVQRLAVLRFFDYHL
ncbi:MAG: CocE/NonD family hydrolase, partial [Oceanidesulfovibrio sp.]